MSSTKIPVRAEEERGDISTQQLLTFRSSAQNRQADSGYQGVARRDERALPYGSKLVLLHYGLHWRVCEFLCSF